VLMSPALTEKSSRNASPDLAQGVNLPRIGEQILIASGRADGGAPRP
jgi:hypothetical protein